MAKAKAPKGKMLSVRIPPPLYNRLRAHVDARGLKIQHVMMEALEQWLTKNK